MRGLKGEIHEVDLRVVVLNCIASLSFKNIVMREF